MVLQNSVNNNYFCEASPGSDLTATGVMITLTANENQVLGDCCYIDGSGEAAIADASAIATAKVLCMCADDAISADASGNYLLMGAVRRDAWNWSAPGVFLYLSLTGTSTNTISETLISGTDECVVVLGQALSADTMLFNPNSAIVEVV